MITKKRWVLRRLVVTDNQLRSLAQITAKFEEWKLLNRGVENEDKS